jgi:hypothetical protein
MFLAVGPTFILPLVTADPESVTPVSHPDLGRCSGESGGRGVLTRRALAVPRSHDGRVEGDGMA